jgi:hypothetical protein
LDCFLYFEEIWVPWQMLLDLQNLPINIKLPNFTFI